jgi:tetratricopeptide (TPR) repeat protein
MFDISMKGADEVTKRLRRFAETQPSNALANYYYAMSLWKGQRSQTSHANQVNKEDIASLLRRSIALDPNFPDARFQLGVLCVEEQKYADAIGEFQAAVKLKPDFAEAHYHLAQAYTHMGEKILAKREFELYQRSHQKEMAEDELRRKRIGQLVLQPARIPLAPLSVREGPGMKAVDPLSRRAARRLEASRLPAPADALSKLAAKCIIFSFAKMARFSFPTYRVWRHRRRVKSQARSMGFKSAA